MAKPEEWQEKRNAVVLWILVLSTMVMILNETVLAVALPTISADFNVGATAVQWLTTGFLLVMAVVIPMTGYLLQRFSTRTVFGVAVALFAVGTFLGAVAPSFVVLLLARMIQAVGTAIIVPLLMTVVMTVVPVERRGVTMGWIGVVISVAPALGPTVSGIVLSRLSWHWLFWVVLPIVLLCLVLGLRFIHNVSETSKAPLDLLSIPLAALGFGGVVYGLSNVGAVVETSQALPVVVFVVGVACLVLFGYRQAKLGKRDAALLDLRPFRVVQFRIAVAAISVAMAVLLGTAVVLPFYVQNALGASALMSGLLVLPGGLLQGMMSPMVGRFYDRHGARLLVIPGAMGILIAEIGMAMLGSNAKLWMVLCLHMLLCVSLALSMTPLFSDGLGSLPQQLYGHGSAILNTLQQLGGAVGTALLVAVMTIVTNRAIAAGQKPAVATAQGASWAFGLAVGLGVIALVVVLFTKKKALIPAPKES